MPWIGVAGAEALGMLDGSIVPQVGDMGLAVVPWVCYFEGGWHRGTLGLVNLDNNLTYGHYSFAVSCYNR